MATAHYLIADLYNYIIPVTPKSLRETLCVAQHAMQQLEQQRPGYNAGGAMSSHLLKIQEMIDECDRMRPLGVDGKHGNQHTRDCGCER